MKSRLPVRLILLASCAVWSQGCRHNDINSVAVVTPREHQPRIGLGEEWMTWTQREKLLYVSGFLDGNNSAVEAMCSIPRIRSQTSLQDIDNRNPGSGRRCASSEMKYSKSSVGSYSRFAGTYVAVMDGFYKHPECRVMPFTDVLTHLNDAEFEDGEQLFNKVHKGQTNWSIYSGLEGMRNCQGYGE